MRYEENLVREQAGPTFDLPFQEPNLYHTGNLISFMINRASLRVEKQT